MEMVESSMPLIGGGRHKPSQP